MNTIAYRQIFKLRFPAFRNNIYLYACKFYSTAFARETVFATTSSKSFNFTFHSAIADGAWSPALMAGLCLMDTTNLINYTSSRRHPRSGHKNVGSFPINLAPLPAQAIGPAITLPQCVIPLKQR